MTDLSKKNITWPFAVDAAIPAKEPRDCPLGSRRLTVARGKSTKKRFQRQLRNICDWKSCVSREFDSPQAHHSVCDAKYRREYDLSFGPACLNRREKFRSRFQEVRFQRTAKAKFPYASKFIAQSAERQEAADCTQVAFLEG